MLATGGLVLLLVFCQFRDSIERNSVHRVVPMAETETATEIPTQYEERNEVIARRRRTLVYPDESTLLLILGLGTPLQLERENVIVGVFTKLIYGLPSNATDFTEPGVYYSRHSKSRWTIYKILEKIMSIYGFGGKECLLRAICEAAHAPFHVHHGLFGQLVQVFLRPSSTEEQYDEYEDREYRAAEQLGEEAAAHEDCHALYPECPRSILDVFSIVKS